MSVTPRHAFLALALLLTLVLALVFGLGAPVYEIYAGGRDRIEDLQLRNERLRRLAASRAEVEGEIARLRGDFAALEAEFYRPQAGPLAAAEMQRKVKTFCEARGATVVSSQPLEIDDSGEYPRISVRLNIKGSLPALRQILLEMESARPAMFLEELSIQSRPQTIRSNRRLSRRRSAFDPRELTVRLSVSGYMLKGVGDDA